MATRMWSIGIGAAVLIAAALALSISRDEDVPAKPAAEPNLFPFLKPSGDGAREGEASSVRNAPSGGIGAVPGEPPAGPVPFASSLPSKAAAIEQSVRTMRAQGASESDIYRMRAAALSPEAATHLASMEREESAWKARVAAYLAERDRLLGVKGSAPAVNQEESLQRLRDARFTYEEQQRLMTYEASPIPQLKQR